MRILMLHNKYLLAGGEDVCFSSEADVLREHGCEVDLYEESNERIESLGALRTGMRTVWSPETYTKIRGLLRAKRYDVIHVQNFFPLISPSAYYAAKAEGVPVVQSLRNYRLVCPVGTFLRDGRICEDCLGKLVAWPGIRHRCYRDSVLATGSVAAMVSINRLLGTWWRMVDVYIALTKFGRDKFVEGGLPPDRIMIKPNFVHPDPGAGTGDGFALFVGRLSAEKGVETLLAAWRRVGGRIKLQIVGDGPLRPRVEDAAREIDGVEYLGWQPRAGVTELMGQAEFLILPSEWYEGQPRVAVEAFARGTPVIAADLGAMREVIRHKVTGLLFRRGDSNDLAERVEWLHAQDEARARMRERARTEFEVLYTADKNYEMLMQVYEAAGRRAATAAGGAGRP